MPGPRGRCTTPRVSQDDKQRILARRAGFVAALAGLAGCGPSGAPAGSPPPPPSAEAPPGPVLPAPAPRPCLSVAPQPAPTCQGLALAADALFESPEGATLKPDTRTLDDFARGCLVNGAMPRVWVEVHADRDDEADNLRRSGERALAIVRHLVARGVARERLVAVGFGDKAGATVFIKGAPLMAGGLGVGKIFVEDELNPFFGQPPGTPPKQR